MCQDSLHVNRATPRVCGLFKCVKDFNAETCGLTQRSFVRTAGIGKADSHARHAEKPHPNFMVSIFHKATKHLSPPLAVLHLSPSSSNFSSCYRTIKVFSVDSPPQTHLQPTPRVSPLPPWRVTLPPNLPQTPSALTCQSRLSSHNVQPKKLLCNRNGHMNDSSELPQHPNAW